MEFQLKLDIKKPASLISYDHHLMLVGSCFTEHIGKGLRDIKFNVLQNPNGILFGADAVASSLTSYIEPKKYSAADLFELNDCWNSWHHHSRFSHINQEACLAQINESQQLAHDFLKKANWLIITLGSSFTYELTESASKSNLCKGDAVANCHRAPASWFEKKMMGVEDITKTLDQCFNKLLEFNPSLNIMLTISPVRHIRDGVVENNKSKARLIESIGRLQEKFPSIYYFPAFELVIDILRDYRFFDVDMVHPNYAATEYVMERFTEACINPEILSLAQEVKKIVVASRHRPLQPETTLHKNFLRQQIEKSKELMRAYPFLNLTVELQLFEQQLS
jgi:hypothetical protein